MVNGVEPFEYRDEFEKISNRTVSKLSSVGFSSLLMEMPQDFSVMKLKHTPIKSRKSPEMGACSNQAHGKDFDFTNTDDLSHLCFKSISKTFTIVHLNVNLNEF